MIQLRGLDTALLSFQSIDFAVYQVIYSFSEVISQKQSEEDRFISDRKGVVIVHLLHYRYMCNHGGKNMCIKKAAVWICVCLFMAIFSLAQEDQFISYSVDGKKFYLTDVKLQSSGEGGFIHLEGGKIEKVDFGQGYMPRFRDLEIGITIELSPDDSIVGTHTAHSSDTMPVYVNWYETVKDQDRTEIREILASMDSGDKEKLEFKIAFENFGPKGTLVKGTFEGKLLDDEGNSYTITDGTFAIKVTDMEE